MFEGKRHDFLRGRKRGGVHGGAAQVLSLVVDGAPLAGFFVDDELPGGAVGGGQGVEGVLASGDLERADRKVGFGRETGGGVGASAPDLAIGHNAAHDRAAAG